MPERRRIHVRGTVVFRSVSELVDELNLMRALGRSGINPARALVTGHVPSAAAWLPVEDIFTRGEDLVIQLELAGMAPDDIDVSRAGRMLTVSGERWTGLGKDGETLFSVRERFDGPFERVIELPEGTQESDVTAEIAHGLVEIIVRGGARAPESRHIGLKERSKHSSR
jgi:HSP20 family protein